MIVCLPVVAIVTQFNEDESIMSVVEVPVFGVDVLSTKMENTPIINQKISISAIVYMVSGYETVDNNTWSTLRSASVQIQ